ncbi:MAG: hypothetical protein A2V70_05460 [Planctomycetes bacterium RBG_13_63_9]|nr:MAG: hypothetical protein A2V70_05460 [Planctomycetes bacterium RBG_13_63_9]
MNEKDSSDNVLSDIGQEEEKMAVFLARYLAQKKGPFIKYSELPGFERLGKEGLSKIVGRLSQYDCIECFHSGGFKISLGVFDFANDILHPPPRDYWDRANTWLRSKRWSLLVLLIVVVPPVLLGWARLLGIIFKWIGVSE